MRWAREPCLRALFKRGTNMDEELSWGIVKITRGQHKGRIALYDDDEGKRAIVYFGEMLLVRRYHYVPFTYLAPVTTADLMERHEDIHRAVALTKNMGHDKKAELLAELAFITDVLSERMLHARLTAGGEKKVFISHSSKDKQFARWLAVDLANRGHQPWLDEWEIIVGESIPTKISDGIEGSDVVIVVLSENAITSKWVENEWQAKYWDEIKEGQVKVLPILLKPCEIPTLLKTKKYADFTGDHAKGLNDLLIALRDR
jgi:hypothetical protein